VSIGSPDHKTQRGREKNNQKKSKQKVQRPTKVGLLSTVTCKERRIYDEAEDPPKRAKKQRD
jgi:hypothetical protein